MSTQAERRRDRELLPVKKTVTPKGVEHIHVKIVGNAPYVVKKTVTPKGVEHVSRRSTASWPRCEEDSDAERR